MTSFAERLLVWWDQHGRKTLPWQSPRSPYRTWIAEVMLQQTQVATAIPYFERFTRALPDLQALAAAPLERVLTLWSGLGYYSRARNLHDAARRCVAQHGGELPRDFAAMLALPGVGRSTAGAILAQAHDARHPILDGNVKRVLTRKLGLEGNVQAAAVQRTLWSHATALLPSSRMADYTQAIMDLGATLCVRTSPDCGNCPVATDCAAYLSGRQHSLPAPRAKRATPERHVSLLLVVDAANRVLLAPRPAVGIWGGLYSVPEFADADRLEQAARCVYGAGETPQALPSFTHAFTHFRLHAQPYRARVGSNAARVAEGSARYLAPSDLGGVALPAPVRRMLESYWEASPCHA